MGENRITVLKYFVQPSVSHHNEVVRLFKKGCCGKFQIKRQQLPFLWHSQNCDVVLHFRRFSVCVCVFSIYWKSLAALSRNTLWWLVYTLSFVIQQVDKS